VIVEKPFSTNLKDLEDCVQLAKENDVILYLAYHSVFGATFMKAKQYISELIQNGDKIISTSARCEDDVTKYHSGHSWIFNPTISGGGALIDCGINILSMLLDVLGPLKIVSVSLDTPEDQKVERKVDCSFITTSGAPCTMFYDWLSKNCFGNYTFTFESETVIQFDWISCELKKFVGGKEEFTIVVNNGETDTNGVPMTQEYVSMLEDAMKHLKREKIQHQESDAFFLTMKCYEKANNKI